MYVNIFRVCKENGAKIVEFDVSFSSDGVAMVFHDDTLERTTNGEGRIDEKTLKEVSR